MTRLFLRPVVFFLVVIVVANVPQDARGTAWKEEDVTPPALRKREGLFEGIFQLFGNPHGVIDDVSLLPEGVQFPFNFRCKVNPKACVFPLYYFTSEGFNLKDPTRRNILFISGGPGQIVMRNAPDNRMLGFLEKTHNVVYFDVRGSGKSLVPLDNEYDQFLRAAYVVEDIERIRKEVLWDKDKKIAKPWDVIYAHSWGTVVAQLYAQRYGQSDNPQNHFVRRLILSAPVVRTRDTLNARLAMTVSNLERIYTFFRAKASDPCDCKQDRLLQVPIRSLAGTIINTVKELIGMTGETGTYDFCFLKTKTDGSEGKNEPDFTIKAITKALEEKLKIIEKYYGSVDFVVDHYADIQNSAPFKKDLGYPQEFFIALKQIQLSGAPQKDLSLYVGDINQQVNAALLVGYYLSRAGPGTEEGQCTLDNSFLDSSACKGKFCKRIAAIKKDFLSMIGEGNERNFRSRRAYYVFGAYDGVTRWDVTMLGVSSDCFKAQKIKDFVSGPADEKQPVRTQAKSIGVTNPNEEICRWSPKGHPHQVPTLILKGSADSVTAGCQAEDFFDHGLREGQRFLLVFRGMGHDMSLPKLANFEITKYGNALRTIVDKFQQLSIAQFRNDSEVKKSMDFLQANEEKPKSVGDGHFHCQLPETR